MSDTTSPDAAPAARFAEQSQRIVQAFWERQAEEGREGGGYALLDPNVIGRAFFEFGAKMMVDPVRLAEAQCELIQANVALWQNTWRRMMGEETEPLVSPERGDRRFHDKAWNEEVLFDYVKQSYLLTARWMRGLVDKIEDVKFRELAETSNEESRRSQSAARDPSAKALREAQQAMSRGEYQRALAILRQEIALSPNDPRARMVEIRLLLTLSRYDEALRSAETAVEAFPNSADMLYMRGVTHMGLERPEDAEQDLRRAVELKPDHVAAVNDLAVVLTTQGKKDEAKKLLEQLLQANPDNTMAFKNLERLRKGSGG